MATVSEALLQELKAQGADFFVSVPCKLLGGLINLLEADDSIGYMAANKEEEALGICAGAYFGGKTPVLIMQNTGIGTMLSSMCSLGLYYGLPITMIVSHRGSSGEPVGAQVPMGIAAKPLLETVGVLTYNFSDAKDMKKVGNLVNHAEVAQRPVAALLDFDFWNSSVEEGVA